MMEGSHFNILFNYVKARIQKFKKKELQRVPYEGIFEITITMCSDNIQCQNKQKLVGHFNNFNNNF